MDILIHWDKTKWPYQKGGYINEVAFSHIAL